MIESQCIGDDVDAKFPNTIQLGIGPFFLFVYTLETLCIVDEVDAK